MGLLDFLNSDEGQLGLNMLAAGGSSTVRMSDGQRMAGAVAATNASKSAQAEAALKKAQLAEALQKTEVEKFGLQRLQDWQKLTMEDGRAGTATAATPLVAGALPTSPTPQPVDTSGGLIGSLQGNPSPLGAPLAQAPASPQGQPAMSSAVPQGSAPGTFRFGLPGIPDRNARAAAAIMTPAEYMKTYLEKGGPQTEIGKLIVQGGGDINSEAGRQMTRDAIDKANYVPPANIRPGGYTLDIKGNVQQFPHVPDGFTATRGGDGQFSITPVEGGIDAIAAQEKAKTLGVGQATPTVRYDNGIPKSSTKANDVAFANGLQPEVGITTNLQGSAEDVRRMISGIKNPQDRANLEAGYARQLTGGGATPQPSTPEQIPGAVSNANVANEASAKTMHDSYAKLQAGSASANSALDSITKMQKLAAGRIPYLQSGPMNMGVLGNLQTSVSDGAAEYEKQRANLIPMLSGLNGTSGTDAGRALTGDSVPGFNKPAGAIKDGLSTLQNQTLAQQAKAQFLTPSYQAGDSKTYTQKEIEFDRNISPSMMPLLTMPAGQSRSMLLQSAARDPAMRARLEWAMQNGMLK